MHLKNVIIINDYDYSQGGASKVAIDTANLLAVQGINCVFFSVVHSPKTLLSKQVKNVTMNGTDFLSYKNKFKGLLKGLKNSECGEALEKLLNDYSPEDTIVHIHGWTKACSSIVFKISEKMGFTTILTLHEYFSRCPNGGLYNYKRKKCCNLKCGSIKCLLSNCDSRNYLFKIYRFIREKIYYKDMNFKYIKCIYVSEFQRKLLNIKQKETDYTVIENPVNINTTNIKEQKIYDFVYIGRTDKEKGIDLFVRLAGDKPEKKFLIVGSYNNQVPSNVTVTGWVSEAEVESKLKISKCLIFPSLWPETFGLNVVKALSYGIPCLVSSNTAAMEYVKQDNGLIFEQGNYNELMKKAEIVENIKPNFYDDIFNSSDKYINKLYEFYNLSMS